MDEYVVAIGIVLCTYALWYFRWKRHAVETDPPVVNASFPILKSFLDFAMQPVAFGVKNFEKYGACFTADMFGQKLTFMIGSEAHVAFFRKNDSELDSSKVYDFMRPIFGKGIMYDATPKRRAQQMQFMANGLRSSRLKTYVSKIKLEAEMYFEEFGVRGTCGLFEMFGELTTLTASRALLGDEVRDNLYAQVAKLYSDLDKGTTAFSFFFPNAIIPAHVKRNRARVEMVKIFSKVIKARRAAGTKADDILQTFMDASYKDAPNEKIPDDHVVGLLIGLLFAGQHTSSTTLTWTLMHILQSNGIYQRVMEEQHKVLENQELTMDSLNEMTLLHACIKEALRLNPPLIYVMRKAMKDLTFKDMVIPKGHIVLASPAIAGKLTNAWSNCDQFDPDRFLDGRKEEEANPFTYISFGAGMHGCMGQQYAYLQLKTVLSVLLRNFSLTMVEKEMPLPDYTNLVVMPSGPCEATYTRL